MHHHDTFASIEPEFVRRAHQMVWCDLATVDAAGRPRTRVVHPVWRDGVGYIVSLRTGPKANDIARNPYASLAYVSDFTAPAYADVRATWVDDRATRIALWEWIKMIPEPLGYDTAAMFGSYDFPGLAMFAFHPWRVRLSEIGPPNTHQQWTAADGG